jgi:hypothetical protein
MHKTLYYDNFFRQLTKDVHQRLDDDATVVLFRVIKESDLKNRDNQQLIFDRLMETIDQKNEEEAINCCNKIDLMQYENTFAFYDAAIKRMLALRFSSGKLYNRLVAKLKVTRDSYFEKKRSTN